MKPLTRILHFVGLAVFVGSIFGHILLGKLGDPEQDLGEFAVLMQAKYSNTLFLTTPGLLLVVITGVGLMRQEGTSPRKVRWLAAKVILVGLTALNGVFLLTPLSEEMAAIAGEAVHAGRLSPEFWALKIQEDIFGALNMALILLTMSLVVIKPALKPFHRSRANTV
ncbi:MAG: hypothetical protein NPIRA02_41890 [Nitrospirales bacterium]|nr:MAG: hypothetical protein NPIRA02_41890 [Nitrospirales bacterium]